MNYPAKILALEKLELRKNFSGISLMVFGSDVGSTSIVRVIERETGQNLVNIQPFAASFQGGVRVALGDINGDGQDDIIMGNGPGMRSTVIVYDGVTRSQLLRFYAGPGYAYSGGISVASADLNSDGKSEVVVGCEYGRPNVGIFNGMTGVKKVGFMVPGFSGGVRVAAGDMNGDGAAEIIVGNAAGGGSCRVLDGTTRQIRASFSPFEAAYRGGVHLAVCDVDSDGQAEIVIGTAKGGRVSIRSGVTGSQYQAFKTLLASNLEGVRVAGAQVDEYGGMGVLVGSGQEGSWANYRSDGGLVSSGESAGFGTGIWVACSSDQEAVNLKASKVILNWNALALNSIRMEKTPPPKASRALAILQTSVFDAVNGIVGAYKGYQSLPTAPPRGASIQAAASQAAYTVLAGLFPNQKAQFLAQLNNTLGSVTSAKAKADGIRWGTQVADSLMSVRQADRSAEAASASYSPGGQPGDWKPTAPLFANPLLPGWGNVTPFVIGYAPLFVSAKPPDLTSQQWTDEFNQVKEIGSKNSAIRTDDQTDIAYFWADGAGTFTPPGHWNAIAAQLAQQDRFSIVKTARLFAQLDVALADAAIVSWKTKYTYDFWRPITAIREGDTDNNPLTDKDAVWEPLLSTPPFPDYTSGHSTFSGAASAILESYFGNQRPFVASSDDGTKTRYFQNLRQAANEAGMSRIYGGIHYMSANIQGLEAGRKIAYLALKSF